MAALPSNQEEIIKEIYSLSLPNNYFNPYMAAPQQFVDDHNALKAEMYLSIKRSRIKIIAVALAILFAAVLVF